jgi:hypothetical protein
MEPNFIVVPNSDPLVVLWKAFPEFRTQMEGDEDADLPYYVYARFADHLLAHCDDTLLWQQAYALMDSMAADLSLQDLLVVELFGALCVDPAVVIRLEENVGIGARKLLRSMLRDM